MNMSGKEKNWLNKMEIVSQEFEVTEEQGGFCPLYLSSVAWAILKKTLDLKKQQKKV